MFANEFVTPPCATSARIDCCHIIFIPTAYCILYIYMYIWLHGKYEKQMGYSLTATHIYTFSLVTVMSLIELREL